MAAVMQVLLPSIFLALCLWTAPGTAITRREGEPILKSHNDIRAKVAPTPFPALTPMKWHSTLAIIAQYHSSKCSATPNNNRGLLVSRIFGSVGESIHISHNTASISRALKDAVREWNQPDDYVYASNTCHAGECAQYTQMIWSSTTNMGCGATLCDSRTKKRTTARARGGPKMVLVVCNYANGGNVFGERPYSTQETAFDAAVLDAHNVARRNVSPRPRTPLPALTWDTRLADVAQDYANKCKYIHNKHRHRQVRGAYSHIGENLYLKAGASHLSAAELAAGVKFWADESRDYHYASNTCRAGRICGHYTQVAWNTSTQVGCGAALCDSYTIRGVHMSLRSAGRQMLLLVCNYGPTGNYIGQRPYST